MKITDRLKVEHGVFLRQLKYVEQLLEHEATRAVLAAAVETVAQAEAHHTMIEDRLLYPELTKVFGKEFQPLVELAEDHAHIHRLVSVIRSGAFDEDDVHRFVDSLRVHLEKEIHQIFPLVEEILGPERLVSLSNWDAEHILEGLPPGKPSPTV